MCLCVSCASEKNIDCPLCGKQLLWMGSRLLSFPAAQSQLLLPMSTCFFLKIPPSLLSLPNFLFSSSGKKNSCQTLLLWKPPLFQENAAQEQLCVLVSQSHRTPHCWAWPVHSRKGEQLTNTSFRFYGVSLFIWSECVVSTYVGTRLTWAGFTERRAFSVKQSDHKSQTYQPQCLADWSELCRQSPNQQARYTLLWS